MSVEFNENKPTDYNYSPKSSGGISKIIIKLGLAKDEKGAQVIMIIIVVLFFALSIYFFNKA